MNSIKILIVVAILGFTVYGLLTVDKAMRQHLSSHRGQIEEVLK
jgi:uncharacterized protein YneF (UPF0154 family)